MSRFLNFVFKFCCTAVQWVYLMGIKGTDSQEENMLTPLNTFVIKFMRD